MKEKEKAEAVSEEEKEPRLYVRTWKLVPVEDWRPASKEEEELFFKEFDVVRSLIERRLEKMRKFWKKMEEAFRELFED